MLVPLLFLVQALMPLDEKPMRKPDTTPTTLIPENDDSPPNTSVLLSSSEFRERLAELAGRLIAIVWLNRQCPPSADAERPDGATPID